MEKQMILNIDLKGATNLVANLPTDKVEYVESVIKFFENNIVAVKDEYSTVKVINIVSTITLGDEVIFNYRGNSYNESPEQDLRISGRSGDLIEGFELLTPELTASNIRNVNKLKEKIKGLEDDKKVLTVQLERLKEDMAKLSGDENED